MGKHTKHSAKAKEEAEKLEKELEADFAQAAETEEAPAAEDAAETVAPEETAEESTEVEEAAQEDQTATSVGEDFKQRYYYLAAEMDNMRKRFERERQDYVKYGNDKILTALLDVLDNFDTSIAALSQEDDEKVKKIVAGIEMIRGQFLQVLKKFGLEPVAALGEIFNPAYHEALMQQEVEGKKDHEIITE
ncbi:MAG: nucleotide exchange factor GrpE, partial [Bacteriovoracaceae bacterium]|nr:nucleotide exchange factor GrpE [Bacteriovoracaceae bacterium]